MIDHITIRVSDIEATSNFYSKALAPLGYSLKVDETFEDGVRLLGFERNGKTNIFFINETEISGPAHIAFAADSKEQVDLFHEEALNVGGVDNGAPGLRNEHHENYYAAYALDPDGNNIEVVFGN